MGCGCSNVPDSNKANNRHAQMKTRTRRGTGAGGPDDVELLKLEIQKKAVDIMYVVTRIHKIINILYVVPQKP